MLSTLSIFSDSYHCMNHLFELEKLWRSIEHNSAIMKHNLEKEAQTSIVRVWQTAPECMQSRRLTAQLPYTSINGRPWNLCEISRCNAVNYPMELRKRQNAICFDVHLGVRPNGSYVEWRHIWWKKFTAETASNIWESRHNLKKDWWCIRTQWYAQKKKRHAHTTITKKLPTTAIHGPVYSSCLDKVDAGGKWIDSEWIRRWNSEINRSGWPIWWYY